MILETRISEPASDVVLSVSSAKIACGAALTTGAVDTESLA